MRTLWLTLAAHRRTTWTGALVLLLTLGVLLGALAFRGSTGQRGEQAGHQPDSALRGNVDRRAPNGPPRPTAPAHATPAGAGEVTSLRAAAPVTSAYSERHRRIVGRAARHPELYARAFTRQLLTQDYRTPREGLLAWVQAESALTDEPQVIGLVPRDLRSRWAVFSVTTDQATAPIPPPERWTRLAALHAHTTVRIQQVLEPVAWSSAVLAGDITDPGVTAREVDALLTLHTLEHGRPAVQRFSVALTMNLEGPPTRDSWGFVTAVTYDVVPLGPVR